MANLNFPRYDLAAPSRSGGIPAETHMFHDTFGHVPMLSNQAFCDFLESLSQIALHHIESEEAIAMISRLYWYTVEFGLIQESDQLRIYGGGILSSVGETTHSLVSTSRDAFRIRSKRCFKRHTSRPFSGAIFRH